MKRFNSSEEYEPNGYFFPLFSTWHMQEALKKEYHDLKTTVAEDHKELPFRNLASADGQDETTIACTGPNPYNYPQLLPDPLAIRLVVLLPSRERHADIVCELYNSALTKLISDHYKALSYVWGDPTKRRPIIVSRQIFQATENLEAALRNLRHPTRPRVLWIDAICINQNNVQERNQQVQLMGHIYRCAGRVIVWLGPESDTSGAAFQLMHSKPEEPDFASAAPQEVQSFWAALIPGLSSFWRLTQRPWFRRVWCIQELVLAREVNFQCGQHCATMNDFLWMQETSIKESLFYEISAIAYTRIGIGNMLEGMSFFMKLAHLHKELFLTRLPDKHKELFLTSLPETGPGVDRYGSALDFFNLFLDWKCSNDKDRIFAFYGLIPTGSPDRDAIRPNYSLSVSQVYIRFAVRYLQKRKDLNILITATRPVLGFVDISAGRELPSWVPDWRDVPRHGRCVMYSTIGICHVDSLLNPYFGQYDTIYDACLSLQASRLEFLHDFRTLCLDGVAVDKVEEIGSTFSRLDIPFAERLQVLSMWKDIAAPSVERDYPYTGESTYEAFWRTLQADGRLMFMPTKDDIFHLVRHKELRGKTVRREDGSRRYRFPPGSSDFLPPGGDDTRHFQTLASQHGPIEGRKLFRTAKGLIGLGPASAQKNDEVAVLYGSRAPFVLRPVGESHRLMGECYVHGIMDGEAIHRPRRREFVDLSDKEFHLI